MPLSPYDWFRFPFSWCYMVLFSWSATIGWNEHPFMWSVTGFCPSVPTSPPVCGPNMQMFAIDKVYPSLWKNKRWFTFSPQLWYFASSEINRWWFFWQGEDACFEQVCASLSLILLLDAVKLLWVVPWLEGCLQLTGTLPCETEWGTRWSYSRPPSS